MRNKERERAHNKLKKKKWKINVCTRRVKMRFRGKQKEVPPTSWNTSGTKQNILYVAGKTERCGGRKRAN